MKRSILAPLALSLMAFSLSGCGSDIAGLWVGHVTMDGHGGRYDGRDRDRADYDRWNEVRDSDILLDLHKDHSYRLTFNRFNDRSEEGKWARDGNSVTLTMWTRDGRRLDPFARTYRIERHGREIVAGYGEMRIVFTKR